MRIFKFQISLFVLLATVCLAIGCATDRDDNQTNFRFFNAVAGFDSVDVLVDTDTYLEEISFLESTAYLEFDTDPHLLQVTPSNSLTALDTQRVSLQDDVDYTYIACGDSSEAEAILLEDDNEPPGDQNFKARMVNVFRKGSGFDIFVTGNPEAISDMLPTVERLRYKAATSYQAGGAGVYDIVVRNTATGDVATILANQNFESESVYSILLVPDEDRPEQVRVLVLQDRGQK